jgi:SAM-dependent methyltransferase
MAIDVNLRNYARRLRKATLSVSASLNPPAPFSTNYSHRLKAEENFFSGCQDANQLPEIYGYWSNTYLRPQLEQFGFSHPEAMYSHYFAEGYQASSRPRRTLVSIGAGNCETEVRLAEDLIRRGHLEFVIECVELNAGLLQQGSELAQRKGVAEHIVMVCSDFNSWSPTTTYDGVLANSSLHHVLNLEGLLGAIKASLEPTGYFVTSDMIGRNGHMRWPEALEIVHEYWRELPKQYTYNHLLKRYESLYENWDCSVDGFEGIRAQDILRLLIDCFEFDLFVPFANVIDPFIDRTFGPNFHSNVTFDMAFIDRLHARDHAEIMRGAIKPTHILAAMRTGPTGKTLIIDGLTPEFCVRLPEKRPAPFRELKMESIALTPPANRDASPPVSRVDYTDMWWNPQESGWGISIHHHRNDRLLAIWCVHGQDGRPIWYLLQPGQWTGPSTFVGPIYMTMGPCVDAPYASRPVSTRCVGSGTLEFVDHSNGTLSYSLDGNGGQKKICRMGF